MGCVCKIYKTAQFTAAPSVSLICLFVFARIFKDQDFFNAAGFKTKHLSFFNIFIFKF